MPIVLDGDGPFRCTFDIGGALSPLKGDWSTLPMMGTCSVWSWLAMDIPVVGEEWLVALFEQLAFSGVYGTRTRTLIEVILVCT